MQKLLVSCSSTFSGEMVAAARIISISWYHGRREGEKVVEVVEYYNLDGEWYRASLLLIVVP